VSQHNDDHQFSGESGLARGGTEFQRPNTMMTTNSVVKVGWHAVELPTHCLRLLHGDSVALCCGLMRRGTQSQFSISLCRMHHRANDHAVVETVLK